VDYPDSEWISGKTQKERDTEHELEYLLGALAGCETATAAKYGEANDIKFRKMDFQVEGDYDFKAHMAGKDLPNRFTQVRMNVTVDTDASQEQVDKLRQLVQENCPINYMLRKSGVDFQVVWKKK